MNTLNKQAQWLAGIVATIATVLVVGGPLTLAEHYAQTGADWSASGYYAGGNARRIACPADRDAKTVAVVARPGVAA